MGLFTKKTASEPLAAPPARSVGGISTGDRGAFAPIGDILRLAIESEASDIHLTVGSPPVFRIHGVLIRLETRALFPEDTDNFARDIANGTQIHALTTEGSVDFAMSLDGKNRFRVSLYKQKGTTAMAMRLLPKRMLSLEEIGLPPIVTELIRMPRGLVLQRLVARRPGVARRDTRVRCGVAPRPVADAADVHGQRGEMVP